MRSSIEALRGALLKLYVGLLNLLKSRVSQTLIFGCNNVPKFFFLMVELRVELCAELCAELRVELRVELRAELCRASCRASYRASYRASCRASCKAYAVLWYFYYSQKLGSA